MQRLPPHQLHEAPRANQVQLGRVLCTCSPYVADLERAFDLRLASPDGQQDEPRLWQLTKRAAAESCALPVSKDWVVSPVQAAVKAPNCGPAC